MNPLVFKAAVDLAGRVEHVLIGTSGKDMKPHIAAASRLSYVDESRVSVSEWFCPMTVINLFENPFVCIVIWDREMDSGYQLIGISEKVEDMAMLDGYTPGRDELLGIPQIERRVLIRVEKIIDFRHAPHNDVEE